MGKYAVISSSNQVIDLSEMALALREVPFLTPTDIALYVRKCHGGVIGENFDQPRANAIGAAMSKRGFLCEVISQVNLDLPVAEAALSMSWVATQISISTPKNDFIGIAADDRIILGLSEPIQENFVTLKEAQIAHYPRHQTVERAEHAIENVTETALDILSISQNRRFRVRSNHFNYHCLAEQKNIPARKTSECYVMNYRKNCLLQFARSPSRH